LNITNKGSDILFGREKITALRKEEAKTKSPVEKGGEYDRHFLKDFAVSEKTGRFSTGPPYIIFSDRTLQDICRRFPSTLPEMKKIGGVGDTKLERYGRILSLR